MPAIAHFEDICQLFSTSSSKEANEYLGLGWVLLNVESAQYSEHGWNTGFVLGWKKSLGEVKEPPERPSPWSVSPTAGHTES